MDLVEESADVDGCLPCALDEVGESREVDVGVVGEVFQPGQDAFVVEDAHGVLLSAAGAG